MAQENRRYLLGQGQELFSDESWRPRTIPTPVVYDLKEAQDWLIPRLNEANLRASQSHDKQCFEGRRTMVMTVHPAFISKSAMPVQTLRQFDLDMLGSAGVKIKPRKSIKAKIDNAGEMGMKLFVAGKLQSWRNYETFARSLRDGQFGERTYNLLRDEFRSFEDISFLSVDERLPEMISDTEGETLDVEVVLHQVEGSNVLRSFISYVEHLGIEVNDRRVIVTSTLAFVPLHARKECLPALAAYSHVRFVRSAAKLRVFRPPTSSPRSVSKSLIKPPPTVESEEIRVAIFDGGISHNEFQDWVQVFDLDLGPLEVDCTRHGSNVTSSFLFGHPGLANSQISLPPCRVDHYRVFGGGAVDSYEVLNRILGTLRSKDYKFVNLSIGPNYALNDDHLDPWTVSLDEIAKEQDIFITVAAGNDGGADFASGCHRIQPPSDGVNVTCVGAVDRFAAADASRCPYSSYGPGRSPGLVKPDLSVFGGSNKEPFTFISSFVAGTLDIDAGTSFASPLVLRAAAGVKAKVQAEDLTPLGVRALLVHHAARQDNHVMDEIGWGVLHQLDPETMISCQDGEVKILYQGRRVGKKIVRTPVPLPHLSELIAANKLSRGEMAELKVTVCVGSDLNPADSANYTRNGVLVTYRNGDNTRTLFSKKSTFPMKDEASVRSDSHKWGTVLVGKDRLKVGTWKDPVLDLHFLDRDRIGDSTNRSSIPYAIVISVKINALVDLYDLVLERYRSKLQPVRPRLAPRIRISG